MPATRSALQPTLIAVALAILPSLAWAQASVDPVTLPAIEITAEKRSARAQDVAVSLSVKTSADLEDAEIRSLAELSSLVPNLNLFSWGGRRDTNVFIRGIGPGLFTEPTVGFYVDGVNYLGNGLFDLDLLDIERIEVLRGPQGTLYGGNSLAGVINIVTRPPADTPQGKLSVQADDRATRGVKGVLDVPLIADTLAWNLAFAGTEGDGYVKSGITGKKLNAREDYSLRSKLRWTASPRLTLNWSLDAESFSGGSYTYGPLEDMKRDRYTSTTVLSGNDQRESLGSALHIRWAGDDVDLTSVTSWRDWRSNNRIDQLSASYGFYDSHSRDTLTQLTQELRLASKGEPTLGWLAGLYAYDTTTRSRSVSNADYTGVVLGGPITDRYAYNKDSFGYALFGQINYRLTDTLTLSGGLRMDDETRKLDAQVNRQSMGTDYPLQGRLSFRKWLPKATLSYAPAKNTLWYGTVAKGYRAGGFDTLYLDRERPTFRPEESTSYELGYKASWFEQRAEFSAALFQTDLKDQQVQRIIPGATAFNVVTDNAGRGRSRGLEAEIRALPARGWMLSAGAAYTQTRFLQYQFDQATDYAGNRFPFAPQFSANLALQHRRPLNDALYVLARVDLQYKGKHYFNAANTLKQDAYTLVNLKLGVEAQRWDAYLWVKNLTNRFYATVISQQGLVPLAEIGSPRTIGATLTLRY